MTVPTISFDEFQRLKAVEASCLLDSDPDESLDRLTRLACEIFNVPIAVISIVEAHRQWFASAAGTGLCESPRDDSFCAHAILADEPLVVEDAAIDPRFRESLLVTGDPFIRFYAGVPIHHRGYRIGAFGIIDLAPRAIDSRILALLTELARTAEALIDARLLRRRYDETLDLHTAFYQTHAQALKDLEHTMLDRASNQDSPASGTTRGDALTPPPARREEHSLRNLSDLASEFAALQSGLLPILPESFTPLDALNDAIRDARASLDQPAPNIRLVDHPSIPNSVHAIRALVTQAITRAILSAAEYEGEEAVIVKAWGQQDHLTGLPDLVVRVARETTEPMSLRASSGGAPPILSPDGPPSSDQSRWMLSATIAQQASERAGAKFWIDVCPDVGNSITILLKATACATAEAA